MLCAGNNIEKSAARLECAGKFFEAERGKAVDKQINTPGCDREMVGRSDRKFNAFFAFCRPAQAAFGDVDACNLGRFPCARKCVKNAGGIVSLAAAGV